MKARAKKEDAAIDRYITDHATATVLKQIAYNKAHKNDGTRKVNAALARMAIELVKQQGFSQVGVGRSLGVDQGTVGTIIRGEHSICKELKRKPARKIEFINVPVAPVKPAPEPELPITMIEPKPGVLRRAWRWLFG
jgi:predicted XRE-type DNA-binding protein